MQLKTIEYNQNRVGGCQKPKLYTTSVNVVKNSSSGGRVMFGLAFVSNIRHNSLHSLKRVGKSLKLSKGKVGGDILLHLTTSDELFLRYLSIRL